MKSYHEDHMNENQKIYLCEDTPDGIFTEIYDAWAAHVPDAKLKLRTERMHAYELFSDYVYIQTDEAKAVKVARSVSRKISKEAYDMMYLASLSYEQDKIDAIYHFLKLGFRFGASVVHMHAREEVCRMFELQRNVSNESHSFREFLRFYDSDNGILIAKIRPKNQILPLLADHFSDRFPEEHFVIIDEVHEMGIFHQKRSPWFLAPLTQDAVSRIFSTCANTEYENMWKIFFRTIAIKERENYQCQRNLCALRFRDYMSEFDSCAK